MVLDDEVEQFAAAGVLHDQVEFLRGLDDLARSYLIELNDVGMSDQFENVQFSGDSLYIRYVAYFLLLEYLDGHPLRCPGVCAQFYFAKGALADCFLYNVAPNRVSVRNRHLWQFRIWADLAQDCQIKMQMEKNLGFQ